MDEYVKYLREEQQITRVDSEYLYSEYDEHVKHLCNEYEVSYLAFVKILQEFQKYSENKIRCIGMNNNGLRCFRNCKKNNLCGLHMKKKIHEEQRHIHGKCYHYTEDIDGNIKQVCGKFCIELEWFCKNHSNLQKIYSVYYKSKNINDYQKKKEDGEISENSLIEDIGSRF
jgi:hypothetical protein